MKDEFTKNFKLKTVGETNLGQIPQSIAAAILAFRFLPWQKLVLKWKKKLNMVVHNAVTSNFEEISFLIFA